LLKTRRTSKITFKATLPQWARLRGYVRPKSLVKTLVFRKRFSSDLLTEISPTKKKNILKKKKPYQISRVRRSNAKGKVYKKRIKQAALHFKSPYRRVRNLYQNSYMRSLRLRRRRRSKRRLNSKTKKQRDLRKTSARKQYFPELGKNFALLYRKYRRISSNLHKRVKRVKRVKNSLRKSK